MKRLKCIEERVYGACVRNVLFFYMTCRRVPVLASSFATHSKVRTSSFTKREHTFCVQQKQANWDFSNGQASLTVERFPPMFTKLHPHDLQWPVEWRRTRTLTSLPDRKSVFQMGSLIRFIMFDTSLMLFVQIRNNKKKRKKSTNAPLNYILKRKEKKLHLSHVFLLFFL